MTPLEAWHKLNPQPEVPATLPFQDGDGMGNADSRSTYTVIPMGEPFVVWAKDYADSDAWYDEPKAWFNPGDYFHGWNDFYPWEILDDEDQPVWAIRYVDAPQEILERADAGLRPLRTKGETMKKPTAAAIMAAGIAAVLVEVALGMLAVPDRQPSGWSPHWSALWPHLGIFIFGAALGSYGAMVLAQPSKDGAP